VVWQELAGAVRGSYGSDAKVSVGQYDLDEADGSSGAMAIVNAITINPDSAYPSPGDDSKPVMAID
jgi:hypothetical protein